VEPGSQQEARKAVRAREPGNQQGAVELGSQQGARKAVRARKQENQVRSQVA